MISDQAIGRIYRIVAKSEAERFYEALSVVIEAAEQIEDVAYDALTERAHELTDHELGFHRGSRIAAKQLRNIAGDLRAALSSTGSQE